MSGAAATVILDQCPEVLLQDLQQGPRGEQGIESAGDLRPATELNRHVQPGSIRLSILIQGES